MRIFLLNLTDNLFAPDFEVSIAEAVAAVGFFMEVLKIQYPTMFLEVIDRKVMTYAEQEGPVRFRFTGVGFL